jgi:hypothetical protein
MPKPTTKAVMVQYLASRGPTPKNVLNRMKKADLQDMVARHQSQQQVVEALAAQQQAQQQLLQVLAAQKPTRQQTRQQAPVSQRSQSSRSGETKIDLDVKRIAKLIRNGTLAVRQQKKTWQAYAQGTELTKKRNFRKLYRQSLKQAGLIYNTPGRYGEARKKSTSGSRRRPSITTIHKEVLASLPQQQRAHLGRNYYLARGRTVRYGGGATGPGTIRVIPRTNATPFRSLSLAQKKSVLNFLNTPAGQKLRGKGARRTVQVQAIIDLTTSASARQKSRSQAQARARRQAIRAQLQSKSYRQVQAQARSLGVSPSGKKDAIITQIIKKKMSS